MLGPKHWLRRVTDVFREPEPSRAQIYLKFLTFSDRTKVTLERNSIVILTGPNNVGKSSALREIRDYLKEYRRTGPVVAEITTEIEGSKADFRRMIEDSGLRNSSGDYVKEGYRAYKLGEVDRDFETHFVGRLPMEFFVSYLGCSDRLELTKPVKRKDYKRDAPNHPTLWLELDDSLGHSIFKVFQDNFGQALVLNVAAGESVEFHVVPQSEIGSVPEKVKEFIPWINSFPELARQGDGMRSFTGAVLSLFVHPRNIVLVDEPEAFLHPPQARRLAEVIAKEVGDNSQIIIATHNDEIVRSLLNIAERRVTIVRLTRNSNTNTVRVLDNDRIKKLWTDALLRTSDVIASLFHGVAIFCEGDSDARFFDALLENTQQVDRDIDRRFFHVGGKDKIPIIVDAIFAAGVPGIAIVDIDILADRAAFKRVFKSFGGDPQAIEEDHTIILSSISTRGRLNIPDCIEVIKSCTASIESSNELTKDMQEKITKAMRSASPWQRIKEDGKIAFPANALNAFERIDQKGRALSLIINPEGELEGMCRTISRSNKKSWLSQVLEKNFSTDKDLKSARAFADVIRETIRHKVA